MMPKGVSKYLYHALLDVNSVKKAATSLLLTVWIYTNIGIFPLILISSGRIQYIVPVYAVTSNKPLQIAHNTKDFMKSY